MPNRAKSASTSPPTCKADEKAKKKTAPAGAPSELANHAATVDESQVDQVLKWILKGHSEHDVAEAVANEFPGADVPALVAAVLAILDNAGQFDPVRVRGFCFSSAHNLYAEMIEIGDYSGALRALKFIEAMTRTDVH